MLSFNRKEKKTSRAQAMILDTCAVIDGRIIDIAKAGFVPQHFIIPQFVIAELQYLADTGDAQKRERARYGLDVIRDLQDLRRVNVTIAREQFKNIREVDDKLIALAKQHGAMLYTTDYNLNKVAQIEGVTVLNVNELAHALRPRRLPGERVELKITQLGQDKTQGVGYLEDGTMVVVEKAASKLGERVEVEFSRMLQTQAGKMMFATLPNVQHQQQSHNQKQKAPAPVAHYAPKQHHQRQQPAPHEAQQVSMPKRETASQPTNQRRRTPPARHHPRPFEDRSL